MKTVLKLRWALLIVWIVGIALLVWTAPNMGDLVREKGQITVPDGYPSSIAQDILDEMNGGEAGSGDTQAALVFHNEKGLSDDDIAEVKKAIEHLEANKEKLGITSLMTHFTEDELESQFVSEDGKTILAALEVEVGDHDRLQVRDALYEAIADTPVEHYFTGGWIIEEDVIISAEEGLRKTELITVGFILLILIIVFRSVITPIIPLTAVGVSYITSQSIVAFLVDWFNFPLSQFTQIFLVVVLFGIGTDYCILLMSRFKEEMAAKDALHPAIIGTYQTAGKTVFYSALAVMAGFAAIGLSTFSLYQSAAAVAIGVAIMFLALVTIVPFFMALLGKNLFWPSKKAIEHRDNKLWAWAGKWSLARPFITLLIVAVIVAPFLIFYDGNLSFNSLDEIGDSYDSVKGFNIIADSFGPGESLPVKIVIQNDERMDTSEHMAAIEKISREVEAIDGIASVRSASRPAGDELEELQVAKQAETLDDGLGEGNDGLRDIRDGLREAGTSLSESAPELAQATDGIDELIDGTAELQDGVNELGSHLARLEQGLRDGSQGADELKDGLQQAKAAAERLASGNRELRRGYNDAEVGLGNLLEGYRGIEAQLVEFSSHLGGISTMLEEIAQYERDEMLRQRILEAAGMLRQIKAEGIDQGLLPGLREANAALAQVRGGLAEANGHLGEITGGQDALADGFDALIDGIAELQAGVEQIADGQREINRHIPDIGAGLGDVKDGQRALKAGFADLDGQLAQLTDGLEQSADGLSEISTGLRSAQAYLDELAESAGQDLSGWFIPQEVLESDDFQRVFDIYMSDDYKVTTIDVVLDVNPYTTEAMNKVDEIDRTVKRAAKGTPLADATIAVSGVTSINNDLANISNEDYSRTVVLMLLSVAIILIVLLRSAVMPLYLMASLLLTYYTSMGITEFVFVDIMGYPGLSWVVPFFGFVILIALGVDYSIFLMHRFSEYRGMDEQEGIQTAMRKMGTVIISAVIILGGTFAALYPSGVLSLLQIATVTISGLLLYAFLFLPFFTPVMVKMFGQANWWPFHEQAHRHREDQITG